VMDFISLNIIDFIILQGRAKGAGEAPLRGPYDGIHGARLDVHKKAVNVPQIPGLYSLCLSGVIRRSLPL